MGNCQGYDCNTKPSVELCTVYCGIDDLKNKEKTTEIAKMHILESLTTPRNPLSLLKSQNFPEEMLNF